MLFVDFSSAFHTITPMKLVGKLRTLDLSTTPDTWHAQKQTIYNSDRPSHLLLSGHRRPPGLRAQPPLVHLVHLQPQPPWHGENSAVSMDNTTFICIIDNSKETNNLAAWCTETNLLLNVSKSKEVIVDFRKNKAKPHTSVYISGSEV